MTKIKKIILIIVLIAVVAIAGWYGFKKYEKWSFWSEIKSQAEKFEFEQARLKTLIEADNYGGKTPEETLDMFITAVEAGDYELASKYFVVERQEKWFKDLSSVENINEFLQVIIETKKSSGNYSVDKNIYIIHNPVLIEFLLYPSDLWKINEI